MATGSCLCGAVRYEVRGPLRDVLICHCEECRRWHGHVGAYTAVDCSGFHLVEQRGLKWYAASPTVRRGFCVECGSSVLFDETTSPKMSICAGTLDAPTGIREKAHIYVGSKGDYYDLSGDLPRYETFPKRAS